MGKRLVILGAGESGVGAALLAKQQGYDVFVSDGSPIKENFKNELLLHKILFEEAKHTTALILNADEVMKTYQSSTVNAYRLYNINVHPVADNTVIVYYEVAQDIKDADGGSWAPHIGAASTYVKRNGQWLNVFYQESVIDD